MPLNHVAPGWVSNVSFILVTLWMDANAILYYAFGLSLPGTMDLHGRPHDFLGAAALAVLVGIFGCFGKTRWRWLLGAFLGGITHVLLDMLGHPEMQLWYPLRSDPPHYLAAMAPRSLLLPLLVWLVAQYVSGAMKILRMRLAKPSA